MREHIRFVSELFWIHASLQFLDFMTTFAGVHMGFYEANPIVRWSVPYYFILLKIPVLLYLRWVSSRAVVRMPKFTVFVMIIINAAYAWLVSANLEVLLK